jgi:ketosteroid isomerase-like protein
LAATDAQIIEQQWDQLSRESPMDADEFTGFVERWWHPEIIYEEDPRWPGSGTYSGRDAVKATFEGYREVLGSPKMSVERVVDVGEQIVALVRFGGTSPGSDVPWDHLWGYLCRVKDGKLRYLRAYWDPDEALADAGVSSSSSS